MKIVNTEKKNIYIYIYNHFIFYSLINKFLRHCWLTYKKFLVPPLVTFCIYFSINLLFFLRSRFYCKSLFYNLKSVFLSIYFSYFLGCLEQWLFTKTMHTAFWNWRLETEWMSLMELDMTYFYVFSYIPSQWNTSHKCIVFVENLLIFPGGPCHSCVSQLDSKDPIDFFFFF